MKVGQLISDLFDLVQRSTDYPKTKDLLLEIQESSEEITDEDLQDYIGEFTEKWLLDGALKNDYEVFVGELNEVVVEFGNEGYFG